MWKSHVYRNDTSEWLMCIGRCRRPTWTPSIGREVREASLFCCGLFWNECSESVERFCSLGRQFRRTHLARCWVFFWLLELARLERSSHSVLTVITHCTRCQSSQQSVCARCTVQTTRRFAFIDALLLCCLVPLYFGFRPLWYLHSFSFLPFLLSC